MAPGAYCMVSPCPEYSEGSEYNNGKMFKNSVRF